MNCITSDFVTSAARAALSTTTGASTLLHYHSIDRGDLIIALVGREWIGIVTRQGEYSRTFADAELVDLLRAVVPALTAGSAEMLEQLLLSGQSGTATSILEKFDPWS